MSRTDAPDVDTRRCVILADFNASNLAALLANSPEEPPVRSALGPLSAGSAALVDANCQVWQEPCDAVLIWTRPEAISEAFKRLSLGGPASDDEILADVDAFVDLILAGTVPVPLMLVCTWVMPTRCRGLGLGDLKPGGIARALRKMNLRLIERLEDLKATYVLDAERWVALAGQGAFSTKGWFLAKLPFGPSVLKEAVAEIKAALRTTRGRTRKLIALDLDNTLWGGVVGENGWSALRLGGHDPIGEAFVEFQRSLKALQRRGILLAIVSRNHPEPVWEALANHPEMVLRREDFVAWRINWDDKAGNIVSIADQLGIGFNAIVFIDDDPAQRARVRAALPDVLVPDWPAETMLSTDALLALRCFDVTGVSEEDRARTSMYHAQRVRETARASSASIEDWLGSLATVVRIEPLMEGNLDRAVQLLNKTNQMNLTTRRLTAQELRRWTSKPDRHVWTFRVKDRFGSAGLVGVASLEANNGKARIVDYVLSCRVLGRGVEQVMVHTAVQAARTLGATTVEAAFIPTSRNGPCFEFWKQSGFEHDEARGTFTWRAQVTYELPRFVGIEQDEPLALQGDALSERRGSLS